MTNNTTNEQPTELETLQKENAALRQQLVAARTDRQVLDNIERMLANSLPVMAQAINALAVTKAPAKKKKG